MILLPSRACPPVQYNEDSLRLTGGRNMVTPLLLLRQSQAIEQLGITLRFDPANEEAKRALASALLTEHTQRR